MLRFKPLAWLLLVCCLPIALGAQKISVNYIKTVDFSQYQTYAFLERTYPKPVVAMGVTGAIDDQLRKKGLTPTGKNPDLVVTFYGSSETDMSLPADDPTYAAYGGMAPMDWNFWYAGANPTAGAAIYFQKGTLDVDILDAHTRKLVWRGTAKGAFVRNQKALIDVINKATEKLFKDFPPKK